MANSLLPQFRDLMNVTTDLKSGAFGQGRHAINAGLQVRVVASAGFEGPVVSVQGLLVAAQIFINEAEIVERVEVAGVEFVGLREHLGRPRPRLVLRVGEAEVEIERGGRRFAYF